MARSNRYNKNLSKVQDMLDGSYKGKIQVSMQGEKEPERKVGDRWFDSDGKEWEQKQGYRSSIKTTPNVGIFSKICKDCGTNCSKNNDVKIHNEVWKKFERCYYCQIDFEAKLKGMTIGEKSSKWEFWARLQDLQRWIAGRKELEEWIDEQHKLNQKKVYDTSIANAMANANISMEIKKNTQ